ncbi:magnesium transporter MRS2-4-like [Ipomoea triloba]|uniref:magnesium transporter MRS2-4-like n=1 Tax=Ipomoea triloba TaxID=35885 RepID=UPI00125CE65E|nr:magnesium transporter MRS2-4-like [Ipomoea triloba]
MGKGKFTLRRRKKGAAPVIDNGAANLIASSAATSKAVKKKAGGTRLWMRFDRAGQSELIECDKGAIIKRASVPARDLRILGPIFSHSSNILAREKAIVVNLEFIKAIVTAEEVLLLDPLCQEVLPFVAQLRQQLPLSNHSLTAEASVVQPDDFQFPVLEAVEGLQAELPFEFHVLEIALEIVCTYLDSSVVELERDAYPVLDELAKSVSTRNLEHVRTLKSNLTRLLARVQKVRDEIEHLLDDNEDMAQLYLTRKWIQNQQSDAVLSGTTGSNSIVPIVPNLRRVSSTRSGSFRSNLNDHDVEDLEMLLEAYFVQLDGTRNKILSVREYIDDTEDYVNIQLDNQRNELIQLQLTLTIASFAIAVETLIAGWFGMNIQCTLYNIHGIFWPFVAGITVGCTIVFFVILGYARWKKLLS